MSLFRRNEDQTPAGARRGTRGEGASSDGAGDAQEQIIRDALADLRDTVVREVMTPRVDIVSLAIPLTVESVSKAVRETGHSCFPVCADNLDDLIGVLFVNDLFRAGWAVQGTTGDGRTPDPIDLARRLRQPFLVPESRPVLDVLATMRQERRAFAVVVDEHGGVEGVLTVKDLLGALVGDLPDEFDAEEEPDVVRVDGSRWLVDGQMSIDDLHDQMGIDLPEGEYVTLGGYLFDVFGKIPDEGATWDVEGGWQMRVAEMDRRRIAKVVVRRINPVQDIDEEIDPPAEARGADPTSVR
jgi:CBS domain containing-hemolysin-like protein